MLIDATEHEVETPSGPMTIHVIMPKLPEHPNARYPGVLVASEIYQTTAPVLRFAQSIAAQGYVVAAPCYFHEFEGSAAIPYDAKGTDRGNDYKYRKALKAYDDDNTATLDLLAKHPNCNGRLAATGMCMGGHVAFRAAFDSRVLASVCYFATDIHDEALSSTGSDSLVRSKEIKGELAMFFGAKDTHVPFGGRTKIRDTLQHHGITVTFCEFQAAHAYIRDEMSKGRFDGALAKVCFEMMMELFNRTVARDLGSPSGAKEKIEHVFEMHIWLLSMLSLSVYANTAIFNFLGPEERTKDLHSAVRPVLLAATTTWQQQELGVAREYELRIPSAPTSSWAATQYRLFRGNRYTLRVSYAPETPAKFVFNLTRWSPDMTVVEITPYSEAVAVPGKEHLLSTHIEYMLTFELLLFGLLPMTSVRLVISIFVTLLLLIVSRAPARLLRLLKILSGSDANIDRLLVASKRSQ
ncbi:hypothetical protein E5Q_06783 [Mixia osmundae IAM 14324]|uniref:Dienelactone hydrolase domain-containing protein n=1 Tax=Mixia osmundae (strain CBS 9802 / IAM 14324 / JCM 22182 / KY 12970) TaxID=764103 RepID=G7EB70_MIXOS|nr:hypothetical protein E5Q_06783 [Mixia osmundae IAM 14324]